MIPAPAVRFGTEVRIRQTEAGFAAQAGTPGDAAPLLDEVEDLLRRGIDCGALIDPWNILGYQGLFPIFPGRDDTVRDPRAEELIHHDRPAVRPVRPGGGGRVPSPATSRRRRAARRADASLAEWWDRFATAHRLATCRTSAAASGPRPPSTSPARWPRGRGATRRRTTSPSGGSTARGSPARPRFAQVIEALLDRQDWRAGDGPAHDVAVRGRHGPARRPVGVVRPPCRAVAAVGGAGGAVPRRRARRRSCAGSSSCWRRTPTTGWRVPDGLARRRGRTRTRTRTRTTRTTGTSSRRPTRA